MRYLIPAVLAAGPGALTASGAAQTAPAARLDTVFAQYRGTDTPGCAVAVSRGGDVLVSRGYGMADLAQGLAITPQSVFHVASVSKQFAGMALVLLAQSGKLSLEDDVRQYLPELLDYGHRITIRHLLNHTSGLRDQWNLLITAGWRLGDDLITEQDVLEIVTRQKGLNFTPGTDWLYSNTGFSLAAIIVKRVTGQTLRQWAEQNMFRPLRMSRTHFHDDNSMVVPGRTRGYGMRDREWRETVPNYSTVGATSLFTTVDDLVQWHRQLDEGTVGGKAALESLLTRGVLTSGDTLLYALGITHGTYRGQPTLSHGGGDPGYRTYLLHFPRFQGGVSVLCNLNEANSTRLAEQTADAYFGTELAAVTVAGDSLAGGALAGATGQYWSEQTETGARVVADSGKLIWRVGNGRVPLRRLTDTRYLVGQGPATIELRPDGRLEMRSANGERSAYARAESWTPTPADRAGLVGRYASEEIGVTWEIKLAGDSLTLHRRKFPPSNLAPVIRDTYTGVGGFGVVIRAVRDRGGRITAVTVGSGRVRRMTFARVGEPMP
jgi:CubicO group peptidase (beta-lactamase class C family)